MGSVNGGVRSVSMVRAVISGSAVRDGTTHKTTHRLSRIWCFMCGVSYLGRFSGEPSCLGSRDGFRRCVSGFGGGVWFRSVSTHIY